MWPASGSFGKARWDGSECKILAASFSSWILGSLNLLSPELVARTDQRRGLPLYLPVSFNVTLQEWECQWLLKDMLCSGPEAGGRRVITPFLLPTPTQCSALSEPFYLPLFILIGYPFRGFTSYHV